MRRILLGIVLTFFCQAPLLAQTAEEIIAKYLKTIGGMEKIQAVKTLRRTGKFIGGGGFEAVVVQDNKRPNKVRREFKIQGMAGISAYDGKNGWQIQPWSGKKDPEALGEEETKQILDDADFDGPLVDSRRKGNTIEYVGTEPVEGTDALKLKVTLANGEVRYYYMDTDYYVPIKIETKRMIRGAEQEFETTLGDYKEVSGWYLPFSVASGPKGAEEMGKIQYETIEANVPLDDDLFRMPAAAGTPKSK